MQYLAIDTETERFGAGNWTPPMVCLSYFDGKDSGLLHWTEAEDYVALMIRECASSSPLVLHNAAYDMAVIGAMYPHLLPEIFAAYDRGGIRDTKIRELLYRISRGESKIFRYSLKDLTKRHLNIDMDKSAYRTEYEQLKHIPLKEWEQGAVDYAINDAICTGKIYEKQEAFLADDSELFCDQDAQCQADFALHLAKVTGLRTDQSRIDILVRNTKKRIQDLKELLISAGLVDPKGKRNTKIVQQKVLDTLGEAAPRTATGRVKADKDVLKSIDNSDLNAYQEYGSLQTFLTKAIQLNDGVELPIHTNFNVLMDTGRTSSSKPNMHNPPRVGGFRECFIPRSGRVYAACDFTAAEMHTLAEVLVKLCGKSRLADLLNESMDVHVDFACKLMGITYEQGMELYHAGDKEMKSHRQLAKVANFGLPGGMGVKTFRLALKRSGIDMPEEQVKNLIDKWKNNFPEIKIYFRWVSNQCAGGLANISHLYSNRKRGQTTYCATCNSFFQGLAADGAKHALYEVTKACYTNSESPLYGARPVNFVHDEIIIEVEEEKGHVAAVELERVMKECFSKYTPHAPVRAEAHLMRRWSKDAGPVYDDNNRLIPWGD